MNYRELEKTLTYDIINQITPVQSLLLECGAKNITDKGSYFLFSSPFREDKNPSAVLYKNSLVCKDFGGDASGSFSYFFYRCTGTSLIKYLEMDKKGIVDKTYFSKDEKVRELKSLEKELRIRGGKILYDFSKNQLANDYIKERFLTEEFLETFEIGYCTSVEICRAFKDSFRDPYLEFTKFRNRICIPIYEGSDLISIEGRDFTKRAKPKVLYPKGGSVSSLFNYHNLNKKEPLIVVEGIMDMPRIWQNITKNITTTFGINLTPRQKEQLKEFEHVIIFSDTDSAGRLMIKEFDDFMEKPYWIARLEDGDPGSPENSLDTIKNAIETAKESTEFLLDESELIESQDYNKNYFSV